MKFLLGMIKQFLSEVDWGNLDYLILDTPPGTSDEHLSATTYLKDAGITGAVIVTTPQEVALLDVRKEIDFCKKLKIPIIGVIENMSAFVCPKCKVIKFFKLNKTYYDAKYQYTLQINRILKYLKLKYSGIV